MRVILTANASYLPPRGGSTRSNLAWLRVLARRGHECFVVAPALRADSDDRARAIESELAEQGIRYERLPKESGDGFEALAWEQLVIYAVSDPARVRDVLRERILALRPDWVLVSSEDFGQVLLREAHAAAAGRVIYLAHTPQMFPFGPASLHPNPVGARLVAQAAAIVAIGEFTARYIETHLGRRPAVIHPPVYGPGPFHRRDPRAPGLVTWINACVVKGLPIFVGLARRFPHIEFGALPGWGTTRRDVEELRRLPNVRVLPRVPRIQDVLEKTRILLVPSLWPEGFGLVVTEAMLMGVPVLASDQGGLVEAKLGTRYVLPVRPIERYLAEFDDNGLPLPVVPEQDLRPWEQALEELWTRVEVYERESAEAFDRAIRFVAGVREEALEELLLELRRSTSVGPVAIAAHVPHRPDLAKRLSRLPAQQREALLERLRERAGLGRSPEHE